MNQSKKKHQKHAQFEKRQMDNFASNEIAFLGTTCTIISELVEKISNKLSKYHLAYFDASHSKDITKNIVSKFTFHHQGNLEISSVSPVNKYIQQLQFSQYDLVFVNGNHYQGAKQILILDPQKEASVLKRLEQLDRIQFIIKLDDSTNFPAFLEDRYPTIKNCTCYTLNQIQEISNHIENLIKQTIAPVQGLVLIGGKSTRMGTDKASLIYHNKSQKYFAKELLESQGINTFFSVRNDSNNDHEIPDTFLNFGPFGGICSAFHRNPNCAWLVLATDLPFLNSEAIQLLLEKRNPSKVATVLQGKNKQFPEPLIAIYEPKAYSLLLQYLALGYSCPRKMLINSDIEVVEIADDLIRNINTLDEFKSAKEELTHGKK